MYWNSQILLETPGATDDRTLAVTLRLFPCNKVDISCSIRPTDGVDIPPQPEPGCNDPSAERSGTNQACLSSPTVTTISKIAHETLGDRRLIRLHLGSPQSEARIRLPGASHLVDCRITNGVSRI